MFYFPETLLRKSFLSSLIATWLLAAPAFAVTITGFTITPSDLNNRLPALGGTIAEFNQASVGFETLSNNNFNYKIESVDVLLTRDLLVDTGAANAGQVVSSLIFLVDTNNSNGLNPVGTITFSQNVIAIQRLYSALADGSSSQVQGDTTFVLAPWTTPEGELAIFGLEANDIVTFAGNVLSFNVNAPNNQVDVFRVITSADPSSGAPIPEPATWTMIISAFGLAGWATRRRKNRVGSPAVSRS